MNKSATTTTKVSLSELATILLDIKPNGAALATVTHKTKPKTLKKCRVTKEPFNGLIEKESIVHIVLNTDYERGIELRKFKEIKMGLETSEYQKGTNTMPIEFGQENIFMGYHKGAPVLVYKPNPNPRLKTKTTWFLDGLEVDKADLPDVLPKTYKPQNQGLNQTQDWRKVYLRNVKKLSINGMVFELI